jgi:hypothetical protein
MTSEIKGRNAKLTELFTFKCALTEGRTVTCMSWNNLNPDLLAVGYGQFEFSKQASISPKSCLQSPVSKVLSPKSCLESPVSKVLCVEPFV